MGRESSVVSGQCQTTESRKDTVYWAYCGGPMDRNGDTETAMNRGKVLALLMVIAGLLVGGFGIWFQHRQMRRITEAFSPATAMLIAYAPQVELLRLGAADEAPGDPETVHIHDRAYQVVGRQRIESLPEFVKVRKWLVRDENYDWNRLPAEGDTSWQFLLDASDGRQHARLALDAAGEQLILLP